MFLSPYRSAVRRASRVLELGDFDLLAVFAVLWIVSVTQVVTSVVQHAVFGPKETFALLAVLGLPWLLLGSRRKRSQTA